MPNGTYGGVRGKETKVGQKTFVSRPTRFPLLIAGRCPIPVGRQAAYGGMLWWELIEVKEYQGDCVGITFYDGRNGMGCWCLNGDCVGDACCEECQV